MRRIAVLLLLLVFIPLHGLAWKGKVVHIADGYTITVLRNNEQIKVRLYGIDTPEKRVVYSALHGDLGDATRLIFEDLWEQYQRQVQRALMSNLSQLATRNLITISSF